MKAMRSEMARAGLMGAGLGAVIAVALAALRLAAGPNSIPVDEFGFREYAEVALAPSTLFVMALLNNDRQDIVVACLGSVAFNGILYGVVAIVAAVAARWRRWLGGVVVSIAGLWIVFWLVRGALARYR